MQERSENARYQKLIKSARSRTRERSNQLYIIHKAVQLVYSGIGDAAVARVLNRFHVLVQSTLCSLDGRCNPRFSAVGQLICRDLELDGVFHSVNGDDVAISYQCNRTANLGFGDNVTDTEAV